MTDTRCFYITETRHGTRCTREARWRARITPPVGAIAPTAFERWICTQHLRALRARGYHVEPFARIDGAPVGASL